MKTIVRVLMWFLVFSVPLAFAENRQALLPLDSPVMEDLKSIYLEAGMTPLTSAGPYTVDEIDLMLEKIDPGKLSPAGTRAYDEIRGNLVTWSHTEPMALHFALHPEVALQGYLHTNTDRSTTYWEPTWSDRLPVLSLPAECWVGDAVYATLDMSLRQTHDAYDPALVAANYTNVPLDLDYIDAETPFRAFLSLGGHSWSFIIGRDRFSWGNGETGNFALSDSPDYYDFARLTGYWRNFKYTAIWVSLSTDLAPYGLSPVLTAADLSTNPFLEYPRNYFLHRIDFCLFDKLSIGISEGTLIGGVQPKLAYFNPAMIFHDLFNYYNASEILAVEATCTPWRWAEAYGQFSCTQIQLPYEVSRYGGEATSVPNAWAFLAGVRARYPNGDGFMSSGVEFAYVNPWMYIKENPLTTYQWWRYQASNLSGTGQWVSSSLGYFTGPDSIVLMIWGGYSVPRAWSVTLSYSLILKGKNTLDTPYTEGHDAAALGAPSGTVERKNVVNLKAGLDLTSFMSLGLDLYGIYTQNFGNVSGQNVTDLQVLTTVRFRL